MIFNIPVLFVVIILVIALVAFLIHRNLKDKKDFETQLNEEVNHPLPPPKIEDEDERT